MSEAFHRGGSGEPLVLLHGFTDTWRAWTPVLPMLERHHTVFAPNLPGHYGGEPFAPGTRISVPTSLDMIERQLDAHGIERAHFAGSSLGGWLALELAGRGRALSVTGICPAGCWERGPAPRMILLYFRRNDLLLKIGQSLGLLPFVASRPRSRALALWELIARPAGVNALAAYTMFSGAANCTVAPDAIRLAASGDMFGDLPAIDCPVRIAYATRDRLIRWPMHYTMIQRQLPDADYVALEGLGHLAMWDDPELVTRTILEVTAPERAAEMAVA
ncbi:MAG TPA: alpha/beta fold hydrolase [Solirubrobacteraceae bacterium]|jgi:pimeloyl-ACP methyl ester carboxylesterase|nr:alpha/beta fold hydrolase [Solirubrobacteraceae bacterium]